MVAAASCGNRMLLERAQARCRLARVEHGGAGALDRVDVCTGHGRDARKTPEEVEGHALAREDRALRPGDARHDGRRLDGVAVADELLELDLGSSCTEHDLGRAQPADDAGLLDEERSVSDRVGRDRRLGGDVA